MLQRTLFVSLLCLGIILVFHSPRWWLVVHESPGTFEWDRALTYLKQCEQPLRSDVEPAMRWRFCPQILVWAVGGGRPLALLIPWLGAWALLAYIYHFSRSQGVDPRASAYLLLLLGPSAPILVSTGWLGINDAWVGLGLCYLAFGSRRSLVVLACIACPFIDERFVFGTPLAIILRNFESARSGSATAIAKIVIRCALAILPFALGKIAGILCGLSLADDSSFLLSSIRGSSVYLWVAPLGAWMALRFAYLPVLRKMTLLFVTDRGAAVLLLAACGVPVFIGFLLASDTMRTAGILLPVCVWAAIDVAKENRRLCLWLALASLIFPAAHVSYTKVTPINSLPVELLRVLR